MNVNKFFRPTDLRIIVTRSPRDVMKRKTRYRSEMIAWEPSFKCTSTGSIVWPHPFECIIAITPPTIKDVSSGTLHHKDVTIAIQNVIKNSKQQSSKPTKKVKKTLAKVRLNLADYYESTSQKHDHKEENHTNLTHKPVSFKLKLRPESSKIDNASINITIQRTNYNPSALLHVQSERPFKDEGDKLVEQSEIIDLPITSQLDKKLPSRQRSNSDASSEDSISQKSLSVSSLDSPLTRASPVAESAKIFTKKNNSGYSSPPKIQSTNNISAVQERGLPKTPPPVPLRDWQKSVTPNRSINAPSTSSITEIPNVVSGDSLPPFNTKIIPAELSNKTFDSEAKIDDISKDLLETIAITIDPCEPNFNGETTNQVNSQVANEPEPNINPIQPLTDVSTLNGTSSGNKCFQF